MAQSPSVIGIETAITDYIYDETRADASLRDRFLQFLKPENPPRKGENILISTESFEEKLLKFAQLHRLAPVGTTPEAQAASIRDRIFGAPRTVEAGGALANSFYLMQQAALDGSPLIGRGTFIAAVGDDEPGRIFADSLAGAITHPAPAGRTMAAHIIPMDGDRIIIANASALDSCDKMLGEALELLENTDISATRMVMLGGYLYYTGSYPDFLDCALRKVEAAHANPAKRPTIALTAGAQAIADSGALQVALDKASKVAPVVVAANTGEFRRLLGMDTDWRIPHEAKWWQRDDGTRLCDVAQPHAPHTPEGIAQLKAEGWHKLEGEALETAKQEDTAYIRDKFAANAAAYAYAEATYCQGRTPPVTFVVTNGKHGAHVISNRGISENYAPPKPPHGVVNTVGGGDAFAGGFLLGDVLQLPEAQKVQLGFTAAGEVIGRDEARLPTQHNAGKSGLPAYLDATNPMHQQLLRNMQATLAPQKQAI